MSTSVTAASKSLAARAQQEIVLESHEGMNTSRELSAFTPTLLYRRSFNPFAPTMRAWRYVFSSKAGFDSSSVAMKPTDEEKDIINTMSLSIQGVGTDGMAFASSLPFSLSWLALTATSYQVGSFGIWISSTIVMGLLGSVAVVGVTATRDHAKERSWSLELVRAIREIKNKERGIAIPTPLGPLVGHCTYLSDCSEPADIIILKQLGVRDTLGLMRLARQLAENVGKTRNISMDGETSELVARAVDVLEEVVEKSKNGELRLSVMTVDASREK